MNRRHEGIRPRRPTERPASRVAPELVAVLVTLALIGLALAFAGGPK